MDGEAQDSVQGQPHDSGAEDTPDWLPTGCAEHVAHLQEVIRELRSELEWEQNVARSAADLLRDARERNSKLRGDIAKCYAAKSRPGTCSDVALRVLADKILAEVTRMLVSEGWKVAQDALSGQNGE